MKALKQNRKTLEIEMHFNVFNTFLSQLGILLEQHVLLNRKNEVNDEHYVNYHETVSYTHLTLPTIYSV